MKDNNDFFCVLCDKGLLKADLENSASSNAHVLFTTDTIKRNIADYDKNEIITLCNDCYKSVVEEEH